MLKAAISGLDRKSTIVLLFDVSVNHSTCIYFKSCEMRGKDCSHALLQVQGRTAALGQAS